MGVTSNACAFAGDTLPALTRISVPVSSTAPLPPVRFCAGLRAVHTQRGLRRSRRHPKELRQEKCRRSARSTRGEALGCARRSKGRTVCFPTDFPSRPHLRADRTVRVSLARRRCAERWILSPAVGIRGQIDQARAWDNGSVIVCCVHHGAGVVFTRRNRAGRFAGNRDI
jgi:hypothetical protein